MSDSAPFVTGGAIFVWSYVINCDLSSVRSTQISFPPIQTNFQIIIKYDSGGRIPEYISNLSYFVPLYQWMFNWLCRFHHSKSNLY